MTRYAPAVEAELSRLLSGGDPDWIEEDEAAHYAPPVELDAAEAAILGAAVADYEQPDRDAHAAAQQRRADALAEVDAWHLGRR